MDPADGHLHVSHAVAEDFRFFYEPFYVARDEVPEHDERFLGYGYTRNTQVHRVQGTFGLAQKFLRQQVKVAQREILPSRCGR